MSESIKEVYKIYNPVTGLYSLGSTYHVRWGKRGKVWNGKGPLKVHLSQLYDHIQSHNRLGDKGWHKYPKQSDPYVGCIVVKYVLKLEEANEQTTVEEFRNV